MRRRILIAFLSVFMLVSLPLQVFAGKPVVKPPVTTEYVGLGDSIGAGWSASPGNDYYTFYSSYLRQKALVTATPYVSSNTAWAGLTTTQLRNEIVGITTQTFTRTDLPGSTIVTISIGGNNLMSPLLQFVAKLYGVSMSDPNFMIVLSDAVNLNPSILTNAMVWQMFWPTSELRNALKAGVTSFNTDLPFIINGIRSLASPKIYLLTVYNPIYGNDTLRRFIDEYIDQINAIIRNNATSLGYTAVNVDSSFEAYTGLAPLVGFDMAASPATYDPHPTDAGHKLIYDLLVLASSTPIKGRK